MKYTHIKYRQLFVNSAILAALAFVAPLQVAKAQQGDPLDAYLNQIADEKTLQSPQMEVEQPAGDGGYKDMFSELMDTVPVESDLSSRQNQVNAVMSDGDALPNIPSLGERGAGNPGMNLPVSGEVNNPKPMSRMEMMAQNPRLLEEQIRREAFDAAITGLFPMTPDNIRQLLRHSEEITYAKDRPIAGVPTPHVNIETVSLDPGVKPMTIKTSSGYITTLNILDVTGAPWPVQDVSWAGDYEVVEPEEGGHVIRITPMAKAAYGNMSIRLLTLKTPITIQLETNPDQVQYRLDVRVPEYGPFAETPLIEGGSQRVAGDAKIMSILDGVYPEDAEKLYVSGVDSRTSAYKMNNMTYVRTPLTLISPSWDQSVSSADGMNVYAMRETPVVLLSDKGQLSRVNLTISGGTDDE